MRSAAADYGSKGMRLFRIRIQVKSMASFQKSEKRPDIESSTQGEDHVDRGIHLDGLTIEQIGPVAPRPHCVGGSVR
jgi:hypothetical protein